MQVLRRIGVAGTTAALLVALTAGSVAATKPARGCPDGFQLGHILDFREFSNSAAFYDSLPPEGQVLAPEILAFINSDEWLNVSLSFDKNGDWMLCLKQGPINKGHLWGWIWNAIDNTANQ
jgi:hypothetical protein